MKQILICLHMGLKEIFVLDFGMGLWLQQEPYYCLSKTESEVFTSFRSFWGGAQPGC